MISATGGWTTHLRGEIILPRSDDRNKKQPVGGPHKTPSPTTTTCFVRFEEETFPIPLPREKTIAPWRDPAVPPPTSILPVLSKNDLTTCFANANPSSLGRTSECRSDSRRIPADNTSGRPKSNSDNADPPLASVIDRSLVATTPRLSTSGERIDRIIWTGAQVRQGQLRRYHAILVRFLVVRNKELLRLWLTSSS